MVEFLVFCVLVGGACSLYESGKKTWVEKGLPRRKNPR